MKKILSFFVAICAIVCVSCNKQPSVENIAGKWAVNEMSYYENGAFQATMTFADGERYWVFTTDGKFQDIYGGSTEEFTYTVSGDVIMLNVGYPVEAKVTELTSSKMALSMEMVEDRTERYEVKLTRVN